MMSHFEEILWKESFAFFKKCVQYLSTALEQLTLASYKEEQELFFIRTLRRENFDIKYEIK